MLMFEQIFWNDADKSIFNNQKHKRLKRNSMYEL